MNAKKAKKKLYQITGEPLLSIVLSIKVDWRVFENIYIPTI